MILSCTAQQYLAMSMGQGFALRVVEAIYYLLIFEIRLSHLGNTILEILSHLGKRYATFIFILTMTHSLT